MPQTHETIRLWPEDEKGAWGEPLRQVAQRALARAEKRLGLTLDRPPLVRSFAPESAFYDELGMRPHNLVAVALAARNEVFINRALYLEHNRLERERVLVHEFAHLLLGRRVPGGLPRWLDEGLAMIAAEEKSIAYHARLAVAASFGGLLPLEELSGPRFGIRDQQLAYAQSLSATRFFLRLGAPSTGGGPGDPAPMARRLAHRTDGRALRELLGDRGYIRALDREWQASIKTFWNWMAALSGGGVFWIAVSGLFLLAYWRKRRMSRAIEERWAEEEKTMPWID